jgi:hypothetical protein
MYDERHWIEIAAYVRFWPNPADGVQDSSLLICKTHEFSLLAEAAPLRTLRIAKQKSMCDFNTAIVH